MSPRRRQDESEAEAKGLHRQLTECATPNVQIFTNCMAPDATEITSHPDNKITGPIPTEIGMLTALTNLRVPPASPAPGGARRQPSVS